MTWNTDTPLGSISVKANRTRIKDNFSYIRNTLGPEVVGTNTTTTRDHFFNVGNDEDGRHRFMQSPGFTVDAIGTVGNPVIGAGMDAVMFLKETSEGRFEWFQNNSDVADQIYQFCPSFVSGSHAVTDSFTSLITVPANVYGEINMFRSDTNGDLTIQQGYFKSTNDKVSVLAIRYTDIDGDSLTPLIFDNDDFEILVARENANSDATWDYRIIYRDI